MLPPDIEETILSTLQVMFNQMMITNVADDILALHVLKQGPLQDDPTAVAPYLVYTKDQDKGIQRMSHELCAIYGDIEIGGPMRFLISFNGICGTPLATTKEQAQKDINNLMARVMNALATHYDLSQIVPSGGFTTPGGLYSQDMSRIIEGANPYYLFSDPVRTRVYGGESTWYGEGHVYWQYPVSWYVG